ncbi:MAG: hypothetical protein QW512_00395 [Thermofilaceae archaeon]
MVFGSVPLTLEIASTTWVRGTLRSSVKEYLKDRHGYDFTCPKTLTTFESTFEESIRISLSPVGRGTAVLCQPPLQS